MSCVFCKIIQGESPARILHHDEMVTAFHDIHPFASTHILVIPNRHIASANDLQQEDEGLMGHMVFVAKEIAEKEGIAEHGYRLVLNTGVHAGQSVFHIHLHLIGGKLARFALQ
jgi:histidine triad (HIT) family protein